MATVKFNLEADEADAVRAFLRVVDAQKKTEEQLNRTTRKGVEQSDAIKSLSGEITGLVGGYVSLSAAIDTARKALEYMNREREAGSNRLKGAEFAGSRLAQLADTPADLRRMLSEAEKSSRGGGMEPGAARGLQFELESAGIGDAREMFAGLYGIIEEPAQIARAITLARNAFGKRARSVRQTLNEAKLASGPETIDLDEVLTNITGIAPGAAQLGGTQEEAFAALSMLSGARKNPEQASTEIRAFMAQAMRNGMGGRGLFGALEMAQQRTEGMSDKRLIKLFGDQEAMRGFQTLAPRLGELRERAAEMERLGVEGPDDQVAGMLRLRNELPDLNVPRTARIAEQTLASLRADKMGAGMTEAETAAQAVEIESLSRGESGLRRGLRSAAANTWKFFGADADSVAHAGTVAGNPETFVQLTRVMSESAEKFEGSVNRLIREMQRGGTGQKSRNNQQVE